MPPDSQTLPSIPVQSSTANFPPEESTNSSTPEVSLPQADTQAANNNPQPNVLPPRTRRLPARYRDQLPEPPCPVHQPAPTSSVLHRIILHVFDSFRTSFNKFGIAREYRHRPSYDPEQSVPTEELANFGKNDHGGAAVGSVADHQPAPWPWSSMSVWRMMAWQLLGNGEKSSRETNRLVDEVLFAGDFKLDDISGFNAETAMRTLDKAEAALESNLTNAVDWDGWKTDVGVDIRVPSREKCSEGDERCHTPKVLWTWLQLTLPNSLTSCAQCPSMQMKTKGLMRRKTVGREQSSFAQDRVVSAKEKRGSELSAH
ncbi:hypothetical protein BKA82DRAFT_4415302 [Pisolithus tinctorius]|nr:hypothetical protein BKA82DRAFT_4415302 [Pisolithus tinctorius]